VDDDAPVESADAQRARAADRRRPDRPRASVIGVLGEILITVGVVVLLYVAWQMWIGDWIFGAERNAAGQERSVEWQESYEASDPDPLPTTEPDASGETPTTADPIILPEPADAEVFAVMRVPRFGPDYAVEMAGGVSRARTLDTIGIGHYPGTQMPGEPGNFAVAAHRTTWGKPFNRIAELRVGDAIVIETPDGWYTYRFRTLEYVRPDEVDVLLPVPQRPDIVEATTAYMTMTSCSPMFGLAERIVAYSVFESFTPRSAGPPASLTEGAA